MAPSTTPLGRRAFLRSVTAAATLATVETARSSSASAAGRGGDDHPVEAPKTVNLPDGIRPEGITSGPGTRFYVGSLADGRIVTGDLRDGSSDGPAQGRHRPPAARPLLGPPHRPGVGRGQRGRRGPCVCRELAQWGDRAGHRRARRGVPQRPRRVRPGGVGHRLAGRPAHPHRAPPQREADRGCPRVRPAPRCVAAVRRKRHQRQRHPPPARREPGPQQQPGRRPLAGGPPRRGDDPHPGPRRADDHRR